MSSVDLGKILCYVRFDHKLIHVVRNTSRITARITVVRSFYDTVLIGYNVSLICHLLILYCINFTFLVRISTVRTIFTFDNLTCNPVVLNAARWPLYLIVTTFSDKLSH